MTLNRSKDIPSWRLVWDNEGNVIMLEFFYGVTQTIHNLFEADTKEECLAKIAELNLNYNEIENASETV